MSTETPEGYGLPGFLFFGVRRGLFGLACKNEANIFGAVLFKEDHQFIEAHLMCDTLHHDDVKHICTACLTDCEDLLTDFIRHLHPPLFYRRPLHRLHPGENHSPNLHE